MAQEMEDFDLLTMRNKTVDTPQGKTHDPCTAIDGEIRDHVLQVRPTVDSIHKRAEYCTVHAFGIGNHGHVQMIRTVRFKGGHHSTFDIVV